MVYFWTRKPIQGKSIFFQFFVRKLYPMKQIKWDEILKSVFHFPFRPHSSISFLQQTSGKIIQHSAENYSYCCVLQLKIRCDLIEIISRNFTLSALGSGKWGEIQRKEKSC